MTRQAADQWRRRWRVDGRDALLSRGVGGSSYLSAEQVAKLDGPLKQGPTAHGWDDQPWTSGPTADRGGRHETVGRQQDFGAHSPWPTS